MPLNHDSVFWSWDKGWRHPWVPPSIVVASWPLLDPTPTPDHCAAPACPRRFCMSQRTVLRSYVSVHGSEHGSEPGSDTAEQFKPVDREGSSRADSYHNAIPETNPSPQPPPPKGESRPMSYIDAQATAPAPSLTVEDTDATPVPPTASALRARAMSQPETAATSSSTDGADHRTSKFETTGRSASLSLGAIPSAAKEKKKRRFKFKNMCVEF